MFDLRGGPCGVVSAYRYFDYLVLLGLNNAMSVKLPDLIVIVGPTASGKTEAGIRIAEKVGGAVVSADSRQVYTGLNRGTAKPEEAWLDKAHDIHTPDVIDGIDHYLMNIREVDDEFSLAQWQEAAFGVIDELISKGTSPLLVGGTMLYIDSIVNNYSIPAVPINNKLRGELNSLEADQLYSRLLDKDPKAGNFVQPQNKRRIIRALEVIESTGQPFSSLRTKQPSKYEVKMYGLWPGWEELESRIKVRVKQMVVDGLFKEKEELIAKHNKDLPLLATINYGQVPDTAEMIRANLRYARRQMSWWRGRSEIEWFDEVDRLIEAVFT